jgi:hypothetical protein
MSRQDGIDQSWSLKECWLLQLIESSIKWGHRSSRYTQASFSGATEGWTLMGGSKTALLAAALQCNAHAHELCKR